MQSDFKPEQYSTVYMQFKQCWTDSDFSKQKTKTNKPHLTVQSEFANLQSTLTKLNNSSYLSVNSNTTLAEDNSLILHQWVSKEKRRKKKREEKKNHKNFCNKKSIKKWFWQIWKITTSKQQNQTQEDSLWMSETDRWWTDTDRHTYTLWSCMCEKGPCELCHIALVRLMCKLRPRTAVKLVKPHASIKIKWRKSLSQAASGAADSYTQRR